MHLSPISSFFAVPPVSLNGLSLLLSDNNLSSCSVNPTRLISSMTPLQQSPFSLHIIAFSLTTGIILISTETYYNFFQRCLISLLFLAEKLLKRVAHIFPLCIPCLPVLLEPTTLTLLALNFTDWAFQGHQWPLVDKIKVKSLIIDNSNIYRQHFIHPPWNICFTDDLISLLPSVCSSHSLAVFSSAQWPND